MRTRLRSGSGIPMLLLAMLLFLPASSLAEPLTLRHAVELALKHANGIAISAADEQHASAAYRELRNSYVPQLTAGAGIGWTDGFPLSLEGAAPSLFNVTAQSALLNPALGNFIHAAQSDAAVSAFRAKDQRNQVIQDVVLSYAELVKWEHRLTQLHEAESAEEKMAAAVAQRVQEGIDSAVEDTKARLSVARVHLRFTEASGAAQVLRERLSKLTGLPALSMQVDPDSVPVPPAVNEDADLSSKTTEANPAVQAAVEHARAQYLREKGEKRSLWPSMDFAAQYANLATYNNYQKFYQPHSFQPNNVTIGVALHFPFFNYAQHSRIQEAEADALKARKQADAARNQASEETMRLQRSVTQMQAARDVAELEYEIAQKNVEAVQTRMESSSATLHDLDDARTQASERLISLQDVSFELERSQVALLRATGDLEAWALGTK
ncbi:MAG: TolC family protein [Candidatus Sulfotelmatobacter sp.]|jgi:outer membrane protein TolC